MVSVYSADRCHKEKYIDYLAAPLEGLRCQSCVQTESGLATKTVQNGARETWEIKYLRELIFKISASGHLLQLSLQMQREPQSCSIWPFYTAEQWQSWINCSSIMIILNIYFHTNMKQILGAVELARGAVSWWNWLNLSNIHSFILCVKLHHNIKNILTGFEG